MKIKHNLDVWECNCGYIVTDVEMMAFRFDYGCPQCGRSFGTFKTKEKA